MCMYKLVRFDIEIINYVHVWKQKLEEETLLVLVIFGKWQVCGNPVHHNNGVISRTCTPQQWSNIEVFHTTVVGVV